MSGARSPAVSIGEQIAEVRRELAMRRHAYPRFIAGGKLTQQDADRQTARLAAALATLERVREQENPQTGLSL